MAFDPPDQDRPQIERRASLAKEIDYERLARALLKHALRQNYPALYATGPHADDITRVLNSLANVLDTLNSIRNNASVAHPNIELLDEPEALLAINAGRSIFAY